MLRGMKKGGCWGEDVLLKTMFIHDDHLMIMMFTFNKEVEVVMIIFIEIEVNGVVSQNQFPNTSARERKERLDEELMAVLNATASPGRRFVPGPNGLVWDDNQSFATAPPGHFYPPKADSASALLETATIAAGELGADRRYAGSKKKRNRPKICASATCKPICLTTSSYPSCSTRARPR